METLGQTLVKLQRERYVGRAKEQAAFDSWLDGDRLRNPILSLTGPGGIGKTWFARRCAEVAATRGWSVHWVDGTVVAPVPADICYELTGESTLESVLEETASGKPTLLVFDGLDHLRPAARFLSKDLLPALQENVKIVLVGRDRLPEELAEWAPLVSAIELSGLSPKERREYAERRGIPDPNVLDRLTRHLSGHPLALSLALDLINDFDVVDVRAEPRWINKLAELVERLTSGLDTQLRQMIEAASVVRRFDEPLLEAMIKSDDIGASFSRLCSLSAVRPILGGRVLHEDIRNLVIDHLRSSSPDRLATLQVEALRELAIRATYSNGETAARLWSEAVYMARDAIGLTRQPFVEEDDTVVTRATMADLNEMIELQENHDSSRPLAQGEASPDLLRLALETPRCDVELARGPTGELRAYGIVFPVSSSSLPQLPAGEPWAVAAEAALRELGLDRPPDANSTNLYILSTVVGSAQHFAALATLAREVTLWFTRGGAYVALPSSGDYEVTLQGTGARRLDIPSSLLDVYRGAYMLDLSRTSQAAWLGAMLAEKPVPNLPEGSELLSTVTDAVALWFEEELLAESPLSEISDLGPAASTSERAQALRNLLKRSLRSDHLVPSIESHVHEALRTAGVNWLPPHTSSPLSIRQRQEGNAKTLIRTQGRFEIFKDGQPVLVGEGILSSCIKVVALKGKLATEELIEDLWPDVDPQAGRVRLRTTLARIRKILPDLLVRDGDTVAIAPEVVVDSTEFMQEANVAISAIRQGSPDGDRLAKEALNSYSGELLPTDRLAEWSSTARERHTRTVLELLDELARTALALGDVSQAVHYLEQAIALDPYDDERYLIAAEKLAEIGWRTRAKRMLNRAYAARQDLGVGPTPAIEQLARRLSM